MTTYPKALLLTLLLSAALPGRAAAQNPFAGVWESREVVIKEAEPGCRYVESLTAIFQLTAGINNTVDGFLTRRFERNWWLAGPSCQMPGAASPLFTNRQDSWRVHGEPSGKATQQIKAVYDSCTTHCKEPWDPPQTIAVDLVRRDGGLTSGLLQGVTATTRYRDSFRAQLDAAEASEAMMALLLPLVEGRCDEFITGSVDPDSKKRFPRDPLCAMSAMYKQLVPNIIRHEKAQAYSVSLGQVNGGAGPLLMSEGDALVQRFVVFNNAGNGVFMGAVLRKQADGKWRVIDVVP